MPLFDYVCLECGQSNEALIMNSTDQPQCKSCGGRNLKKLLSAHSSMSGFAKASLPGPKDTGCCGISPSYADCSGPGSCCGKN